jgi:ribonuclease-3
MTALAEPPKDAKTSLQEWAHRQGFDLPAYAITARSGPPHAPAFEVTVTVGPHTARGTAGSKRAAEQLAAEALMRTLDR